MIVVLNKQETKRHVKNISTMTKTELSTFVETLFMSPIDDNSRKFILKACELRFLELQEVNVDPMAVCSDINDDWDK